MVLLVARYSGAKLSLRSRIELRLSRGVRRVFPRKCTPSKRGRGLIGSRPQTSGVEYLSSKKKIIGEIVHPVSSGFS